MKFPEYVQIASVLNAMFLALTCSPSFSSSRWLGQNSKMNKNYRQLNDIHIHMRLKVSANMNQVREHYVPTLFGQIVEPLFGKDGAVSGGFFFFLPC